MRYVTVAPSDEVPDICGFLDGKKRQVDEENSAELVDNLRHYAYEGDGNSTGSLSSLASGTDDGDLNFEYLSEFGPRFRKLADMYGEHSSDESEANMETPGSESWCWAPHHSDLNRLHALWWRPVPQCHAPYPFSAHPFL